MSLIYCSFPISKESKAVLISISLKQSNPKSWMPKSWQSINSHSSQKLLRFSCGDGKSNCGGSSRNRQVIKGSFSNIKLQELWSRGTWFWSSDDSVFEFSSLVSVWRGSCVTGSIPIFRSFFFIWVFQWFLISLSVRPGNLAAIFDHLN